MKRKITGLIIAVGVLSSGCATRGPAVLSQCLSDDAIMSAYQDFQSESHEQFIGQGRAYLTGGYNEETEVVSCYWQTHSLGDDLVSPLDNPISVCNSAGNDHCAILMDGPREVFQPSMRTLGSSGDDSSVKRGSQTNTGESDLNVVYYLLGAFVEGMARGLVENYANRPARSTYNASYNASRAERHLRCNANPIPGPWGPSYTCRR